MSYFSPFKPSVFVLFSTMLLLCGNLANAQCPGGVLTCSGNQTVAAAVGQCTANVTVAAPTLTGFCAFPNNALDFSPAAPYDVVNCLDNVALQITGNITLEAWIKVDAFRANIWEGSIINKEGGSPAGYMLRCGGNGILGFTLGDGANWSDCNSAGGTLQLGVWTHVAATYDGSYMRLYKNGVLIQTTIRTGPIANVGVDMYVGGSQMNPSRGFDGQLDEVRIWNIARPLAQIQATMNTALFGARGGLVACYGMDQGVAGGNNAGITVLNNNQGNVSVNGAISGFDLNNNNSNFVAGYPSMVGYTLTNSFNGTANASGSYPVGATTVNWTATDFMGNTASCGQTITVTLNQTPVLTCTGNQTLIAAAGQCSANATVGAPTMTGICTRTNNALDFSPGYPYDAVNCMDNLVLQITNTITLEAWIKVDAFRANLWEGSIINKEGQNGTGYMLRCGGNGNLGFTLGDGANFMDCNSGTGVLQVGVWTHVAATYDGANMRIYKNGVLVQTTARTGPIANAGVNMYVGGSQSYPDRGFDGQLDEVRVWNAARTAAQIQTTMNTTLVGGGNLVACYGMDQGVAGGDNTALTILLNKQGNGFVNGNMSGFNLYSNQSNFVTGCPSLLGYSLTNSFNGTANASGSYPVGNTTVIWTATDLAGNTASCSQTITVTDNQAPVLTCPGNVTANPIGGQCTASVTVPLPTATDNCPGVVALTNSFNGTGNASGVYPLGVTNVTFTATDAAGNTASCSFSVTVASPVSVTGNGTICAGASITLTATNGISYIWNNGATTASIVINPFNTTIYTVTATIAGGCTVAVATTVTVASVNVTVDVSENYDVANDGTVCLGMGATLSVPGAVSYLWSNGATTATLSVIPNATTTYTVTVTTGLGCTATGTRTINVGAIAAPIATDMTIICGQSVTLTATGINGTTLAWHPNANSNYILATGGSYALPQLNAPVTYYVDQSYPPTGQGPVQTVTFNYTHTEEYWTVPDGVTQITVDCYGAEGTGRNGYTPGRGGRARGTINVFPGQQLYIMVGGQDGWGWGGAGWDNASGGGASTVESRDYNNNWTREVVAGGGGGAGGDTYNPNWACFSGGGHGGGGTPVGTNFVGGGGGNGGGACGGQGGFGGGGGNVGSYSGGGGGGGLSSGGGGGNGFFIYFAQANNVYGQNGTSYWGGYGGMSNVQNCGYFGVGGGGGGYTGGGGGAVRFDCNNGAAQGAQGGGGSSWTGTAANPFFEGGVRFGNGQVTLTYRQDNYTCATSPKVPVSVTINPIPAPTVNSIGTISCGDTRDLVAYPQSGGAIAWYDAPTGGNMLFSGATWTRSFNTTVTLYAEERVTIPGGASCSSNRTAVTVTVLQNFHANTPLIVEGYDVPNDGTVCLGKIYRLVANGQPGSSYSWSDGTYGMSLVDTAIQTTTTYTVTEYSGGCSATSAPVTITGVVNFNMPTVTVSDDTVSCLTAVTMTANGLNGNIIRWYNSPTESVPLATGNTFTTPQLTESRTYYVDQVSPPTYGPVQDADFNFTGSGQSWTVPENVFEVTVDCYGAEGMGINGGIPGRGGRASGTMAVVPGQVLSVVVGGQSGYNGGGAGVDGANGGGMTSVQKNGSLQIVAGGGGGIGGEYFNYWYYPPVGNSGHGGGGDVGPNYAGGGGGVAYNTYGYNGGYSGGGTNGNWAYGAGGGGGGLTSGGSRGETNGGWLDPTTVAGHNGGFGYGGAAESHWSCSHGIGGGGGGYFGGGGGAGYCRYLDNGNYYTTGGGQGGGGSSWTGSLTNPSFAGGVRNGNGFAHISFRTRNDGCASMRTVVPITLINVTAPVAPDVSIYCGQAPVLNATGIPGATIYWYAAPSGGSPIATGGTYAFVDIDSDTTFYVDQIFNGCYSSRVPVHITVNPLPTPAANNVTVALGDVATLQATGANGQAYNWYAQPSGGTPIDLDAVYVTPVMMAPGTVTYYVELYEQVDSFYTTITFNTVGPIYWPVPNDVSYIRTNLYGALGGGYGGYGAVVTTDLTVSPGEYLDVVVGGAGNGAQGGYNGGGPSAFAIYQGGGGGGATDIRRSPYGLDDRLVAAGGGGGGGYDNVFGYTYGGSGGQYGGTGQWLAPYYTPYHFGYGATPYAGGLGLNGYSGSWGYGGHATGVQGVNSGGGGGGGWYGGGGGGSRNQYPAISGGGGGGSSNSLGFNTTYYYGANNTGGRADITYWRTLGEDCHSVRVPVTVTVAPIEPPIANGPTIICGQTATLTATGINNATFNWYTDAVGGTLVGTGSPFSLPGLTSTTTFYVEQVFGAYTSSRTAVTVTVNPYTIQPFSVFEYYNTPNDGTICQGGSATLTGNGVGTYLWSNGATTPAITVLPQATTTYTLSVTPMVGCAAATASATVAVDPSTLAVSCPANQTVASTPGQCTGTVTMPVAAVSGLCSTTNNALSFDGVNDWVQVNNGSAMIAGNTTYTMEGWVNFSPGQIGNDMVFGFRDNTNADFYILRLGGGNLECRFRNSAGTNFDLTPTSPANGGWNHLALTYDGSVLRFYLNGTQTASIAANGSITNSSATFGIGGDITNNWLLGKVDEVRVWTVARTQAQIQADMNLVLNGAQPNLVACYGMDQGIPAGNNAGITILDNAQGNATFNGAISGLALNGNISNFVAGNPSLLGFSISNSFNGTGNASGNYPIGSTTVTWTATDQLGNTATCTHSVTVTPPTISITGPNTTCVGTPVTLTASGGNTYAWSNGATTAANLVSPFTTTTYTVTASLIGGCQSYTASYTVTVTPNPLTFNCPANQTVNSDIGQCTAVITVPAISATYLCPQINNALAFDGVNDGVQVPNGSGMIAGAAGYTIEGWVNLSGGQSGNDMIFGLRNDVNADFYILRLSNGTGLECRFRNSAGNTFDLTPAAPATGSWNHMALTYDGSTLRYYLNGTLAASMAASGSITNPNATFGLGNDINSNYLVGRLDEVRVWNVARTQGEIQAVMNQSLSGVQAGLMACYGLNQGNAGGNNAGLINAMNTQGNALYNGTLYNFALNGNASNFVAGAPAVLPYTATNSFNGTANASGNYPFGATTVNWTVSDQLGNTVTCSQVITVNPPTVAITGSNSLCAGGSTQLTASGSGTYLWSNGATAAAIVVSPILTTNYTVSVTLAGGCQPITANYTVTVTANPLALTCPANQTVTAPAGQCTASVTVPAPTGTYLCPVNNALDFANSSPYDAVNCGNNAAFNMTNNLTLEAWIYADAWRANTYEGSIFNKEEPTGNLGYMLRCGNNGTLNLTFGNGGVWRDCVSNAGVLPLNTWVHVAATYDGTNARLYVNGALVQTTALPGPISTSTRNLYIGGSQEYPDRIFDGKIDEARVWNVARTQGQIQAGMGAAFTGPQAGLVANYSMNQGVAGGNNAGLTTVLNVEGNTALNGTLLNMALNGNNSNFVAGAPALFTATNSFNGTTNASGNYPFGNTTVTWTATDQLGNTVTCNHTITVNPPVVAISGSNNTCTGSPVTLTASGGNTYLWSTGATTTSIVVSPVATTTYTVTASLAGGCQAITASFTVTVTPNTLSLACPANQTATADAGLCAAVVTVPVATPTYPCPITNNALSFDGTNDWVQVPNASAMLVGAAGCTIEGWVNLSAGQSGFDMLFGFRNNSDADFYILRLSNGTTLECRFRNSAGTNFDLTPAAPVNGIWSHIAFTYDGSTMRFYLNGSLVSSGAANGSMTNGTATFGLGNDVNSNFLIGQLDEVRVWNVARSQAQILANMNLTLNGGAWSGLTACYGMDQGTAGGNNTGIASLLNKQGNAAYDGSIQNFALNGNASNFVAAAPALQNYLLTNSINGTGNASDTYNSGATTVTWTATDQSGATTTCSHTVTVSPAPISITGPNAICNGNSATLGASGGVTHLWSNGATTASITVTPVATTTYSVTATLAGGCTTSATTTLTVANDVLTCAAGVSQPADAGLCSTNVTVPAPLVVTNCMPAGNALDIDPSSPYDVVNCGNNAAFNITGNITVEAWIYADAWRANFWEGSIITKEEPTGNLGYMFRCGNNGSLNFTFGSGGNWRDAISSQGILPLNTWTHVAATYDGTNIRMYVNGSFTVSVFQPGSISTNTRNVYIGGNQAYPDRGFNGKIDEARIWNVTRSQAQIQATMNTVLVGAQTGLVACYGFDQGIGGGNNAGITTITNNQGNALLNGALSGLTMNGNNSNLVPGAPAILSYTLTNSFNGTNNASGNYNVGTNNVTWTVTDFLGNTNTCSQQVTVTDDQVPTIACPANLVVNGSGGACSATVTFAATATDNCGSATISYSPASGSAFNYGTTTVTATANDGHGNISTCSFTVTVNDNEAPVVTCPTNIVANGSGGACSAIVTFAATATDNCGTPTISYNPANGSTFPIGNSIVTVTADDGHGNTSTCSFTVTVNDNEAPVVACPANLVMSSDGGACSVVVTFAATATDNCGTPTISYNPANGSTFPVGTTAVTVTADDGHGNTSTCSFNVTVTDNETPVVECPANLVVNATAGACSAIVTFEATATDNCGTPTISYNPASGSTFNYGTTTVTVTADDGHGNTSNCSFTVTVNDNEAAVVTCPANIVVNADAGACYGTVTYTATATDNCGTPTISYSIASGSTFNYGNTDVTVTADDGHGNTSTCSFTVTVNDNEAPVVTCPANLVVDGGGGACSATVTFEATATDNCGSPTISYNPANGSSFPIGTTAVTATANDGHGNTSTCSFSVTVNDNQAPSIVCPANMSINGGGGAGACSGTVTFAATATDNCGTPTLSYSPASGSTFDYGNTVVMVTANDGHGNTSTCSFSVTVNDTEDPIIGCPGNIVASAAPGQCSASVTYIPTATDNCGTVSVFTDIVSGSIFNIGTTTVTATANDGHGNIASCTFTVTVNDTEAPTIICPANLVVNSSGGACSAIVTFGFPVFDNCGAVTPIYIPASGSTFPIGSTTVISTADDGHGNTASCSFTVTVNDAEVPAITCPGNQTQTGVGQVALADYTGMATATDNCGQPTITQSPVAGTLYANNQNVTVTLTATDAAGNTSACTFSVSVTIGNCGPGSRLYVDDNPLGNGNNGTSWDNAFLRLESALAIATPGTEIWVKEGTYKPTPTNNRAIFYNLPAGVQLYGGFPQVADCNFTLLDRNPDIYVTNLSGDIGTIGLNTDNSFCLMKAINVGGAGTIVDGFVFRDAYSFTNVNTCALVINADGASVPGAQSSPEFANCLFTNNYNDLKGGAIYLRAYYAGIASPTFTNCDFVNNSALGDGGVIFSTPKWAGSEINPSFESCTFSGNSSQSAGGVVYSWVYPLSSSIFSFSNCTFNNNTADGNGGVIENILRNDASSTFNYTNCDFTGNSGLNGSAVYNYNITGVSQNNFIQCLFNNNTASADGTVYSYSSKAGVSNQFDRVAFNNNTAVNGGGTYEYNTSGGPGVSTAYLNCVLNANTASANGGGIYALSRSGTPMTINMSFTTMYGNMATVRGGAVANINQSGINSMTVYNSIVRGNLDVVSKPFYTNGLGANTNANNCLTDNVVCSNLNSGTGAFTCSALIATNPMFVNAPNGDLHLAVGSGAIDMANSGPMEDYDGFGRPAGVRYDYGAFEYGGVLPRMSPQEESNSQFSILNSQLNIYPNPTTGKFTVEFNKEMRGRVEVMDMQGRIILLQDIDQAKLVELSMSGHASGAYLVRLVTEMEIVVQKLVVRLP